MTRRSRIGGADPRFGGRNRFGRRRLLRTEALDLVLRLVRRLLQLRDLGFGGPGFGQRAPGAQLERLASG